MLCRVQRLVLLCGLVANIAPFNLVGASVARRDNSTGGNPLTNEFAKFVNETLEKFKVPGLAMAVVDNGQVYSEGYGFSSLPNTRATPKTLWYAGSTTKAQTAAALSVLIHNRTYPELAKNWSTPISSIIENDFVLNDTWRTEHMTLDDAVSHRSGLGRSDEALLQTRDNKTLSLAEIVQGMRNLPLTAEPRTKVIYNNWMYITMSHVIETITGKGLGEVMRETIWQPLGMDSTYFTPEGAKNATEPMASGYIWNNGTQNHTKTLPMPMADLSGAAAVISNVEDYAKWIKCLLNQTKPFSKDVHADIREPRIIQYAKADDLFDMSHYGLGWYRNLYRGRVFYRHDGVMIGFGSLVYWFPNDNFGFVLFSNGDDRSADVNTILSRKLMADRFGAPDSDYKNLTTEKVERHEKLAKNLANATSITYPNISQPLSASPVNVADLVGKYSHIAHGTLELREGTDARNPNKTVLTADRWDTTWRLGLRFHHVIGEKWVMFLGWIDDMDVISDFYAAEFQNGTDGKVSGLKVTWEDEPDVVFTKD